MEYFRGIQLLKHNLFYPGVCDLAKIENLYERSSNLKQIFEGIRVKWMTPQEEGAAGVKTRKKAKSKNMSASVRQGSRQWQNLRIFMLTEVWSGSCQMIHAH